MAKSDAVTTLAYNFLDPVDDNTDIEIFDTIAGKQSTNFWTGEKGTEVTPTDFQEKLNGVTTNNITIRMNSAGGEVSAANVIAVAIQEARNKGKHIVCKILGVCASAAVQIAIACDEIIIHQSALMMIHNPLAGLYGYYDVVELKKVDNMLTAVKNGILSYYVDKTGMSKQKLSNLMDEEKYMDGKEAVELGFADSLMFEDESKVEDVMNMIQNVVNCNDFLRVPEKYQCTVANTIPSPNKEGETEMEIKTVNELKAKYPDLVNEIIVGAVAEAKDEAVNEGKEQERARLQAIDEMAGKVSDELLMKAKYETFDSAEKVAMEAIKTGAFNAGTNNVLAGMAAEGAQNNAVPGGVVDVADPNPVDKKKQEVEFAQNVAADYFKTTGRGGTK